MFVLSGTQLVEVRGFPPFARKKAKDGAPVLFTEVSVLSRVPESGPGAPIPFTEVSRF